MIIDEFADSVNQNYSGWVKSAGYWCYMYRCNHDPKDVISNVLLKILETKTYEKLNDVKGYMFKCIPNELKLMIRSNYYQQLFDDYLKYKEIQEPELNDIPEEQFTVLREKECDWRPDTFLKPQATEEYACSDQINARVIPNKRIDRQKRNVYARMAYDVLVSVNNKHNKCIARVFDYDKAQCIKINALKQAHASL